MILGCPNCATRFVVDPVKLGPNGRKVKCASCGHVWHATPLEEADPPTTPPEVFPEEFKSEEELAAPPLPPAPEPEPEPVHEEPAPPQQDMEFAEPEPEEIVDDSEGLTENARLRDRISDSEEDVPLSEPENAPARFAHEELPASGDFRPRRQKRGLPGWLLILIALLVLLAGVIIGLVVLRGSLEGEYDFLDPFYNQVDQLAAENPQPPSQPETAEEPDPFAPIAPNLQFAEISSKIEDLNNFRVLLVRGKIRNIGSETATIPPARAVLYDDRKNEIDSFDIQVPVSELAASAETDFSARLSDPPIGVTALQVEFYRP